jgi:hypothetical protein
MRKFLLNLAPGEPLALVQELPFFDNPIKMDPLLARFVDLCVHDLKLVQHLVLIMVLLVLGIGIL